MVVDNELIREIVVRTLRKLSFQVEAVADGAAAVEAVKSKDYDLILMDVSLLTATNVTSRELIPSLAGSNAQVRRLRGDQADPPTRRP